MATDSENEPKRGRPTLLTPEVHRQIVALVEDGDYIDTACLVAGVSRRDFNNWLKWGREGTEPYAAFFLDCDRARAKAESDLLKTAKGGDEKGESFGRAKAAITILERTRPRKFSQRVNLSLEKELDSMLTVAEKTLDAESYAKLIEAISAAEAGEGEASGD